MTDARERTERGALPSEVLARLGAHRNAFLAFLERRVPGAAEDVLQEGYRRALASPAELRDPDAAIAWFYRLLRNAATDHHRRSASRERLAACAEHEMDRVVEPSDRVSPCGCVVRLVPSLKAEYASAVRRVDLEGVDVRTYAGELGITPNLARVRLFRARAALRKRLHGACGSCADEGCRDCSCGSKRA